MKIIAFIAFLFIALTSHAQKNHLSLSMGLAKPLGNLSHNENYETDGFAMSGFNLNFEGNYIPLWYLGIGGAISFSTNPVYKEALLRKLKTKINQYEQPDIPSFADISFEQEFWSYVLLLVGPTLSIPGERIQWNLKAHLGLSVIFPPTETLEASFDNSTYYHSADAQNLSFCYAFGADAIYKLQSNYSIKLGANYIHTQSEKQTHLNYTEDNTTQLLEGFTKKDVLNALHLTLGLAYLF